MILIADVILHFAVSTGLIIFLIAIAGALYNNFQHRKALGNVLTGLFLGLASMLFHFIPFSYNDISMFDYRFILLVIAGVSYSSSVLLSMAPFYLGGILITYSNILSVSTASVYDGAVFMPLLIAIFSIVYCLLISTFGFKGRIKSLLTIVGVVPIVFSEPLITGRADIFDGKMIFALAVFVAFFAIVLAVAFLVAIRRNLFGATTVSMYISSIFSKYENIYHFSIDRKRNNVKFSKRFYEEFELTCVNSTECSYAEFVKMFSMSLADTNPDISEEKIVIIPTVVNYIYVTPKTSRRKYITYVCRENLLGYFSGQIKDITNTIAPEEVLHQILRKNHITGFKTYYVMKEEMLEAAKLNAGLMMQLHLDVTFSQKMESLYSFEFENECYHFFADLLRKELPNSLIYSIKESEFQLIIFDIERTENALKYANKLMELFIRPYEIMGKRVSYIVTAGVLVSESLKCDTIEKANLLITKAFYAKDMAMKKKPGSIYFFDEDEYKLFLELHKRGEMLPAMILGGEFYSVFQPIVSVQNASVFAYEVLTRVKNNIYKSTSQLIMDSYQFGLDKELDIAIIKGVSSRLKKEEIPYNLFLNKLTNTPVIEEFGEIATSLKKHGKTLYVEFAEFQEYDIDDFRFSVAHLNSKGIKIAIDDYGKGYSSQSMVSNTNPSVIKIDMELVTGIHKNKRKEIMVKGIVEYCDSLGIDCLAEGISSIEELAKVIELGVDYLQGFYLGKPNEMPMDISEEVKQEIRRMIAK